MIIDLHTSPPVKVSKRRRKIKKKNHNHLSKERNKLHVLHAYVVVG
jgi:hypothetical protein